ncbi:MAG: hypothetical protein D6800_13205, partial [Candidatus Zixiibacteriota bacterium]
TWRDKLRRHPKQTASMVFFVALVIGFYGSLMIWNYRPLRYQLPLIYGFHTLAAVALAVLWRGRSAWASRRFILWSGIALVPVFFIVAYRLAARVADAYGQPFFYADEKYWLAVVAVVVIVGCYYVVSAAWFRRLASFVLLRRAVVLVAVVGALYPGMKKYVRWVEHPTFTTAEVSRDLARLLAPDAVLSGPYAASLVRENALRAVIHMFGVAHADTTLFARMPVTHLLVDYANKREARHDYPAMMAAAVKLYEYTVGDQEISLYRIAGATGNPVADSYTPSPAEDLLTSLSGADTSLSVRPDSVDIAGIAVNTALAERYEENCDYPAAEQRLQKAVEFSPTSYVLAGELARLYRHWYISTGEENYRQRAESWYTRAIELNPDDVSLIEELFDVKDTAP